MSKPVYVKCVIVGDANIGKTCLLISYSDDTYSEDYVPTVCGNISMDVDIDGRTCHLALWDTAGQEGYTRVRPLTYREADVFLLAFSLVQKPSYANLVKKWIDDVRHNAPGVPIVLVGTKLDLRENKQFLSDNPEWTPISTQQGMKLKKEIDAAEYIECSAKTRQNVKAVFDVAMRVALKTKKKQKKKEKKCTIM